MEQFEKVTKWLKTENKFTNGDNIVIWLLILGQFLR